MRVSTAVMLGFFMVHCASLIANDDAYKAVSYVFCFIWFVVAFFDERLKDRKP